VTVAQARRQESGEKRRKGGAERDRDAKGQMWLGQIARGVGAEGKAPEDEFSMR